MLNTMLSGRSRLPKCVGALALLACGACGGVTRNGDGSDHEGTRDPASGTAGTAGTIAEPSIPPSVTEPGPASCDVIENAAIVAAVHGQLGLPATHVLTGADLAAVTSLELKGMATLQGVQCLTGLQVLKATGGTLSDLSPVAELSLRELDVSYNALTDLGPLGGYRLPTLQRSNVAHNQITSLSGLADKPALMSVDAAYNSVTSLSRLQIPHLKRLDLSHNDLRNLGASISMPELEQLEVSNNGLSNLDGVQYFGALILLSANNNPLASIAQTSRLPNLRELDVSQTLVSEISVLRDADMFDLLNLSDTLVEDLSPIADWAKNEGLCNFIYLDGLALDPASVTLAKEGFCSARWELHPFCPGKCPLK